MKTINYAVCDFLEHVRQAANESANFQAARGIKLEGKARENYVAAFVLGASEARRLVILHGDVAFKA